jgi:hypothetical protein
MFQDLAELPPHLQPPHQSSSWWLVSSSFSAKTTRPCALHLNQTTALSAAVMMAEAAVVSDVGPFVAAAGAALTGPSQVIFFVLVTAVDSALQVRFFSGTKTALVVVFHRTE